MLELSIEPITTACDSASSNLIGRYQMGVQTIPLLDFICM